MENQVKTYKGKNSENANNPAHYTLLTIGIFVTVLGSMLRFAGDWALIDVVSNIIFLIGVVLCLKAVVNILK
ncbi:MAG: hypothetical protein ACO1N7_03565 [Sphingobacteriaceae bacterium]